MATTAAAKKPAARKAAPKPPTAKSSAPLAAQGVATGRLSQIIGGRTGIAAFAVGRRFARPRAAPRDRVLRPWVLRSGLARTRTGARGGRVRGRLPRTGATSFGLSGLRLCTPAARLTPPAARGGHADLGARSD